MSLKKRRMVNGKEIVFRRPGEEGSADESDDESGPGPDPETADPLPDQSASADVGHAQVREISEPRIIIHEDD